MAPGWASGGRSQDERAELSAGAARRATAARAIATALGLLGTVWAAAAARADRWSAGSDIPVVAGAFAAPLAAHLLVRGAERRDRRLLWSLAAGALPLYATALWVVAEVVLASSLPLSTEALRRALLGGSMVTGFVWCGLSTGASMLAAEAMGPHPGRRVLALGVTTLPAAAAFGWSLDRLPLTAALGPAIAVLPAALLLPWVARGLDRATTARLAVVAAVALYGGIVTGALSASVAPSALAPGALESLAVEAPVAVLRLAVPVAALVPVLAMVVAVRALHGPMPASKTAIQAALALAVCTLPLVLQALALRETGAAATAAP